MKKIFVETLEELQELKEQYNLQDCGMSKKYYGWHWYQDDDAKVAVYFKLSF